MFKKYDFLQERKDYKLNVLKRKNIPNNPFKLLKIWINKAYTFKIIDFNAMCLATVDKEGCPYQRMVLLKYFNNKYIIFFTNLKSRKSQHLINNNNVSLTFYWSILERQIMILGKTKKLSFKVSKKYFYTRPINSQLSVWASKQSQKIKNRNILEKKFFEIKKKFKYNKNIPFPIFWGGYQVEVSTMEFWQGRPNRLHDRFIYKKKQNKWIINRLSP